MTPRAPLAASLCQRALTSVVRHGVAGGGRDLRRAQGVAEAAAGAAGRAGSLLGRCGSGWQGGGAGARPLGRPTWCRAAWPGSLAA
jgi:hypothetical protein